MMVIAASGARADDFPMLLEVVMNGRQTGQVGEFIDRGGALYARPSELRDLGFLLPPQVGAGNEPIALSKLRGVQVQINRAKQTLLVAAEDAALQPTELGGRSSLHLAPLTRAQFGAVLNYDILGTFTGEQTVGGALLDARIFGPYGLLESTSLSNLSPYDGQNSFTRLDTTYTFSQPDETRRWRLGDVVSGTPTWGRSVRLGGAQIASDFGLRPDLVTYPLPMISASTAVPSTVDVMVNGIQQYTHPVQPGPFTVQTLPIVTGAGEVAVMVQNALGQQVLATLPFYASSALLKPGLSSYSVEMGALRGNYGLASDKYTDAAFNGSLRYGLSNWLTLEGHSEAAGQLILGGIGAVVKVGAFGVVNLALSGSAGDAGLPPSLRRSSNGGLVSLGFQRLSRHLNLSVVGTVATKGYRDLAAVGGTPVPMAALSASVGYQLDKLGSIGVAYVSQRSKSFALGQLASVDGGFLDTPSIELATLTYSVPIGNQATFYATGFKDLQQSDSYGVGFGISFLLGRSNSASVGGTSNDGRSGTVASIAKPALSEGDFGYQVQDIEGYQPQRQADGEYLSHWGRVTAGVIQSPGVSAGRASANGALVWAGDGFFAAPQINDSFAVVRTGGVPDVPVTYENRLVGTTDSNGELLVPSLLSYQNNKLAVDPSRLPADIEVGQTTRLVRPAGGSGMVVNFDVRAVKSALLTLKDKSGQSIPLGSVATPAGGAGVPVGYDGQAYVTGLTKANILDITLPDGSHCRVRFDYKPVKGQIPVIGPLVCQ
jgi:outer membrane usher protein